jgi:hypothetical protein
MAKQIAGPLIQLLRRDDVHAQDIAAVLEFLRRRLAEEGIPFAVIGALALRQYGFVRATEDIDILTTPEGLKKIHSTLVGRGLVPRGTGLRKLLCETEHEVNIDVRTSGEHAGSDDSPTVYPPPDSDAFVDIDGVRFPTMEALVEFKIARGAGATVTRTWATCRTSSASMASTRRSPAGCQQRFAIGSSRSSGKRGRNGNSRIGLQAKYPLTSPR